MSENAHRQRLIDMVRWAGQQEERVLDEVPPATGQWTVEQLRWHTATWRRQMSAVLRQTCRGGDAGVWDGDDDAGDQRNVELIEEANRREPSEVARAARESVDELVSELEAVDDACLHRQISGQWRHGEEIEYAVAGNALEHVIAHLGGSAIASGRPDVAARLYREAASLLPDTGSMRPRNSYNLACMLALSGDREGALNELRAVLPGNGELREWARSDGDLDSLRDEAGFRELVGS